MSDVPKTVFVPSSNNLTFGKYLSRCLQADIHLVYVFRSVEPILASPTEQRIQLPALFDNIGESFPIMISLYIYILYVQ